MSLRIGIDLGTTFSAVAYVNQHGKAEIIPNREGERTTPSVVMFDGHAPIVGSIAKRSAVANPDNVVQFVKRQMGSPSWKFRTEAGDQYLPEDVSAIILKRLKEDAEEFLGETITDAVVTVPAYFGDAERKATQDAGRIAGLNVLRIINEPTAAALAYGVEKVEQEQTVLVYDLGGGTFDVTIMRIGPTNINVIATGGDKNLGGFDWDNRLMEFLNEEFKRQGGSDLLDDPALTQDLRDKAEIAKKTLSSRDTTKVFLSGGGRNWSCDLSAEQFEELTESLLKRTASIMEFVLEDASLAWSAIDKILLVGGSTRMRAVPRLVEQVTGKKPSRELPPDEIVAIGAALQAALVASNGAEAPSIRGLKPLKITDVTAYSMGVVAVDEAGRELNSIVLKKQTPVPCKVSELFHTISDNQREILVQVTEGEDSDLKFVKICKEAPMKIPPYPKGAPLEVFFAYNDEGRIEVTVIDRTANTTLGTIEIPRDSGRNDADIEAVRLRLATQVVS